MTAPADDRIKESLADILEWAKSGAEKGGELFAEQVPLVCQEIVAFGRVYSITWLAVGLLSGLFAFYLSKKAAAAFKNLDDNDVLLFMASAFAFIVSFALLITSVRPCILAWFAPRLYVLEYIGNIIK